MCICANRYRIIVWLGSLWTWLVEYSRWMGGHCLLKEHLGMTRLNVVCALGEMETRVKRSQCGLFALCLALWDGLLKLCEMETLWGSHNKRCLSGTSSFSSFGGWWSQKWDRFLNMNLNREKLVRKEHQQFLEVQSPWGSCEFKLLLITCNQVSQFCNQYGWMWNLGFNLTWIVIKQIRNRNIIVLISCFLQGYASLPGCHGQKVLRNIASHEAYL